MIDWHCHLLPGVDDGPRTLDEALAMAAALAGAGYAQVHCTPHYIRGHFQVAGANVREGVRRLQGELDARRIPLRLLPGREYYLDEYLLEAVAADPLPLGESNLLLVEIGTGQPPELVKQVCYQLKCRAFTPLIAHPERCRLLDPPPPETPGLLGRLGAAFGREPAPAAGNELLDYLQQLGCGFQGNMGSFAGLYGERVRQVAERHRAAGRYTCLGTDAHSREGLEMLLSAGDFGSPANGDAC